MCVQPSLTGNGAKVAIICNVTPASSQSEETWNTLRFADGAKRIKVRAAAGT
jgi:centromeric protein E